MSSDAKPALAGRPRWWVTAAKYALGLAVLAYVISTYWRDKPGSPGLESALRSPRLGPALLAGLLMIPGVLLTLVRWWGLARALDLPLSLREANRLGLLGYFFNTVLPGGIGGDAVKVAAVVRSQERRTAAVASILFDRAVGLGGLVVLVALVGGAYWLAGDPMFADRPGLAVLTQWAWLTLLAVVSAWWLLGWLPPDRVVRISDRLRQVPRLGGILAESWYAVVTYRRKPAAVIVALVLSVLNHVGCVLAFYVAAHVFCDDPAQLPSLRQHYIFVPAGLAVRALFPAPGGAGGAEWSFAGLYQLAGSDPGLGVLASLASLVLTWVLGVVAYGGALMMGAKATLPAEALELDKAGA